MTEEKEKSMVTWTMMRKNNQENMRKKVRNLFVITLMMRKKII